MPSKPNSHEIKSWKDFSRKVRLKNYKLLQHIDDYENAILVTGCQRSGTTMLARTIANSRGIVNYHLTKDDELDAALILAGIAKHRESGRYCFQTTYLNENYHEYFEHPNGYKVIWVVRNPFSVIYSMLYNWKRFAFNELFHACGKKLLTGNDRKRFDRFGTMGVNRVVRACLAYNGKTMQLFDLMDNGKENSILVVNYDEIVLNKSSSLKTIYDFINLPFDDSYSDSINSRSINKHKKFSEKNKTIINEISMPLYERAIQLTGN